jgi:hypothetical protein
MFNASINVMIQIFFRLLIGSCNLNYMTTAKCPTTQFSGSVICHRVFMGDILEASDRLDANDLSSSNISFR